MGKLLTRDEILAANDILSEEVHVPEWDGDVLVWTLTGEEKDAHEAALLDMPPKQRLVNARAVFCSLCIRTADRQRIFAPEDVAALGKKSIRALLRVWDVAHRLNGTIIDREAVPTV